MGMIIEISEDKIDELAEGMEDMLHVGGKMMSCIERLREGGDDDKMGRRYGRRMNRRGSNYGRRDENEDWDDDESMLGNRRGRDGRYM